MSTSIRIPTSRIGAWLRDWFNSVRAWRRPTSGGLQHVTPSEASATQRTLAHDQKPRHMLHLLDSGEIGGGPRILLAAARGLRAHNWTASVICGDNGPLAEDLRVAGLATEALPIARQYRFLRRMPQIIGRIRRQRPDVVIAYGPIAGCLGGIAARLAGVKGVIYAAGYPAYYADRGLWRRIRNAVVEKISCTCADVVWCKSAADVALYHHRRTARPAKFKLVPNCVSKDVLQQFEHYTSVNQGAVASLRAQLRLAPTERIIGYVGRLVPEKGIDVLLRAYAQALPDLPATRLVVVGDGPERVALERLAVQLGLGWRVVFVGAQRDIVPFYLLTDMIAIPSHYEPFGNVAIEAMACARAIVASRVGGLAETVIDGECGRLVPPGDPAALASALCWVVGSPERAAALGRFGRQRALATYTEERLAQRLDTLARETLA